MSERIAKLPKIYDINSSFTAQLSLKNLLCKSGCRIPLSCISGIVQKIHSKNEDYIKETSRNCTHRGQENRKVYKKDGLSSKFIHYLETDYDLL